MFKNLKKFFNEHKTLAEIIRFLIVGGGATVVDMFTMGVILYLFQPQNYEHFYNVFYGATVSPSSISTIIGTGAGFLVGLLFNYIFSVIFVFEEKGKSKTVTGFALFALFSFGGFLIHLIGMYLGYDLLHINEWIIKIVLTIVVLIYNYITRKIFVFKKTSTETESEEISGSKQKETRDDLKQESKKEEANEK